MLFLITIALLMLLVLWVILSLKIAGPDEMAVEVAFGRPRRFHDSGLVFVPFLFDLWYLQKFPKKIFQLSFKKIEVVTMAGRYKDVQYGAQIPRVDSSVYINFPRKGDPKDHPLMKILQAKVPIEEAELQNWTEEVCISALRDGFGNMTWKEATENRRMINEKVADAFNSPDGILWRVGFLKEDVKIVVEDIDLPSQIKAALTEVDTARIGADAAKKVAEKEVAESIGAVLEMMVQISPSSKTIDQIKAEIQGSDQLREKFLETTIDFLKNRMAIKGKQYFRLDVPGVKGELEQGILAALARWIGGAGGGTGRGSSGSGPGRSDMGTERDPWD